MHAGQHTIQSRTPACASTAACAGFRDARASHCPQLRASHPLPSIACLPTDFRPQVQGLCHNHHQVSASLVQTSRRWACLRPAHTPRSSPTSPALSTFGRPATACVLPPNCCACHLACRHAVAVPDLRGDQGHYVPCFMTFHRAVRCSRAQHCGQRWCSGTASAGRANLRWHAHFGPNRVCQSEAAVPLAHPCHIPWLQHPANACTPHLSCLHLLFLCEQVMLEFENALLSVVPELKAMPYW